MNEQRLTEILRNRQFKQVYYEEKPVWIQAVTGNTATIGFIDGTPDKQVFIEDLYDEDLYKNK